jgi:hypothetical protein
MEKSIGRSKRCPTCSSIIEASPSSLQSPAGNIFSRPSYDIVFFMSFLHRVGVLDISKDGMDLVKLYKIKIYTDSRRLEDDESRVMKIRPFWKGLRPAFSSFAALDRDFYCLGGQSSPGPAFVPYAYVLTNSRPYCWVPLPHMNFPRIEPPCLVLDGNVYVLSGHFGVPFGSDDSASTHRGDLEVYRPRDGRWDVLPDPPIPLGYHFMYAALENPSRILVAVLTAPNEGHEAVFCVYDVKLGNWELLDNPERQLHGMCPRGLGGKALSVGNTLYWITDNDHMLLAYLLDLDKWLLGDLGCLDLSIFGYREWNPPILLHLQDQRFCMVQSAPGNLVHCVILDVLHKPIQNMLEISVVSVEKFKVEDIAPIEHCFLL